VRSAIGYVLALQTPRGEIAWERRADGRPAGYALLTGCSSIYQSLRCAVALAACGGEGSVDIVAQLQGPAENPLVRMAALEALCASAARSRTALELAAVDGAAAVRRRAAALAVGAGHDDLVSRFAADPDESVRAAVELLGAERIGHGLAAAQDPAVLALLRERGVPLEVSLTSNVATGALAQVSDHPLPRFLDEGVCVTLNSDDPGLFGTTLEQEFRLAAETFGLSREQLEGFTANAIHAAFLAEAEKSELRKALQAAL